MSKKWKKRLGRIKKVAVKAAISIAGTVLAPVTFGASAVLAAGALAYLAKVDAAKAAKVRAEAAARQAAGETAEVAAINALTANAADQNAVIRGILDGSISPGSINWSDTIQAHLGTAPGGSPAVESAAQASQPAAPGVPVPPMFALLKKKAG